MDVLGLTEKGRPARTSRQIGSRHVMSAQHTADNVLIDVDAESQRDLLRKARTTQLGLRCFMATTTSMRSLLGPFGPGRRRCPGENKMRYFRWRNILWRGNRVEGFRTMAERRT